MSYDKSNSYRVTGMKANMNRYEKYFISMNERCLLDIAPEIPWSARGPPLGIHIDWRIMLPVSESST